MATTARKAVYVRGPDDVYRRKDSGDGVTKKQVDTFINELMECGFRVAPDEPQPPPPVQSQGKPAKQDLSLLMNPKRPDPVTVQSDYVKKHAKLPPAPAMRSLSRLNTDFSPSNMLPRSGSPHNSTHVDTDHDLDCNSETWTAHSHAPISHESSHPEEETKAVKENFLSFLGPMARKAEELGTEKLKLWTPPFLAGMFATYALQQMLPLLLYYGVIAAHLMKLFIAWLVFTGGVCWYFGVLSLPAGSEYVEKLQVLLAKLPIKIGQHTHCEPAPSIHDDADVSDLHLSSDLTYNAASERRPSLPEKESAKSYELPTSIVNVMPFVAPKRQLFRRANTDLPKSTVVTSSFDSRELKEKKHLDMLSPKLFGHHRQSKRPQSSSPVHSGTRADRRHSSSSLPLEKEHSKGRKHILASAPTLSHDSDSELPFICEMKLRSKTESDMHYNPNLHAKSGLKRSGTYMSQKSVLGTRANYSKFLANFDD